MHQYKNNTPCTVLHLSIFMPHCIQTQYTYTCINIYIYTLHTRYECMVSALSYCPSISWWKVMSLHCLHCRLYLSRNSYIRWWFWGSPIQLQDLCDLRLHALTHRRSLQLLWMGWRATNGLFNVPLQQKCIRFVHRFGYIHTCHSCEIVWPV